MWKEALAISLNPRTPEEQVGSLHVLLNFTPPLDFNCSEPDVRPSIRGQLLALHT
jgi:hypothetical protein